jgi:hypothetical protein
MSPRGVLGRGLVLVAFLAACAEDEPIYPFTVTARSPNNMCSTGEGPGTARPGEPCEQAQSCAMVACCTCPGGARMFSAAACHLRDA